jgi:formylmethanofuran dehydrogenase subunit C
VSALTFQLKDRGTERLDLSPLSPLKLAGKKPKDIETISIGTTRERTTVGDVFKIKGDDALTLRFIGTDSSCDRIGRAMTEGEILVDGDAGAYVGAGMSGGKILVKGSAGALTGGSMLGGEIEIGGNSGERTGGVADGESLGMRGGRIVIGGDVGDVVGHRMRRGTIIIGGNAGEYAGGWMVAGTIMIDGKVGKLAGYGLRRGTLILAKQPKQLLPTFSDSGKLDFNYLKLLGRQLDKAGFVSKLPFRARRLMGDMAVLGKGEMLILA